MCGIAGFFNLDGSPLDLSLVAQANLVQRHRGPDDEGYLLVNTASGRTVSCGGPDSDQRLSLPAIDEFRDQNFDLALCFRRLAILDLSPTGHQPMCSADGKAWIVFNGEIYNYLELRSQLISLGHQFQTGSDTEVILAAYREWGNECLQHFNGMFAFVIWDASAKALFVARDRFGEKPFHYVYEPGKVFAFASEMKGLWAKGVVKRKLHAETLALYESYNQVDSGEQTFFEGIQRLPQAHYLVLSSDSRLRTQRYWDLNLEIRDEGKTDVWYADRFRELLTESIRMRLRADVPVGSSLSGGLDSTAVVSVINRLLPANAVQKTFSARFDDPARDEGKWMALVTKANRVEPHDVWPTAEGFWSELQSLFWHQEEPFTSTSVYAQWNVMRLAREHEVTVLLDGQGADETLGGYHAYFDVIADDLIKSLKLSRYFSWRKQCQDLHGVSPGSFKRILIQSLPSGTKNTVKSFRQMTGSLPSLKPLTPTYPAEFKKASGLRKLLWWNTTRQGLVELLRYADRNSMAHSREVRLPFLDHKLVEFVFSLPERQLHRNGWTKWILRESVRDIIPAEIADRVDKLGYMPPQQRWIGKRNWSEIMIDQLKQGYEPVAVTPTSKEEPVTQSA